MRSSQPGRASRRIAIGDGQEHRDDERRRAAHPGGARQIAGDRDVAPLQRRREVADDAADDGGGVVVPVRAGRLIERQLEAGLGAVHHVDHRDDGVLARRHRHHEAALGGAEQAAAAGVVGVLAEHLDAARHPVAARRAADAAGVEHGPRGGQQARLALRFLRAQARRRQLVAQMPHGSTVTPASACSTAATSPRRDRSRTPSSATTTSKRTPSAISALTASTSSYSPRTERVDAPAGRVDRRRHPPAGHADERVAEGRRLLRRRLLDDAREPAVLDHAQREGADPVGRDVALRQQRFGPIERRGCAGAPDERRQRAHSIVVVAVDDEERVVAGPRLRGGDGVGRADAAPPGRRRRVAGGAACRGRA